MTDPTESSIPRGLERAFQLPDWAEDDPELVELHATIVQKLQREAHGLQMNTVQQLLLERIAFNYIVIKYKEETNGFVRTEQKDLNAWWLSMTQEFNKLLQTNQDKMRETLLLEINDIVKEALKLVTSDDDRRAVYRTLSERFAAIDL